MQRHYTNLPKPGRSGKGESMQTTESGTNHERDTDKKTLTIVVHAPRFPDPMTFTWEKTMKVAAAAAGAASAFGYAGGNPGLQTLDDPPRQLDPNKPLVAEHLEDGDELEITDTGGGV